MSEPKARLEHEVAQFFLELAGVPEPAKAGLGVLDKWDRLCGVWADPVNMERRQRLTLPLTFTKYTPAAAGVSHGVPGPANPGVFHI